MLANATRGEITIPTPLFASLICVVCNSFDCRIGGTRIFGQSSLDCHHRRAPVGPDGPVTTVVLSDHHGDIRDIQHYIF